MNKNRRSIEILYNILNYTDYNDGYSKRLVIIEPRGTALISKSIGPYLSFEDLSSGDFFEIYRYKKSLEENEDEKRK